VSCPAGNGHPVSDAHVPFENYQTGEKSFRFFSNLIELWK
jgi:hypothetical protein